MASNSVNVRFIIRNDTGENWTTKNPILKKGELGVNTDNGLLKIGDDVHVWSELSYINDPSTSKAAHYEGTAQDAETDEEVIQRVLTENSAVAAKDDIFIVKRTIAGEKVSYTAYVYNGTAWAAMDGNYNAKNVFFSKDLVATANIGTVTVGDSGNTTVSAAGKSVEDVLAGILAKEENPKTVQPAVSVSFSGSTNVEVGTQVTPTYSATLSAGSYTYGPATGITATSWSVEDNATPKNTLTTASGSFPLLTIGDSTTYRVTATATYDDGAMPLTNIGNEYPAGQIKAGSATKTVSTAISGYRNFFYGILTTSTAEEPLTSAIIRGLTKGGAYSSAKTLTVKAADVAGAKRIVVAYPASSTRGGLTSVLLTSSMNADITADYVEKTNVDVEGANGYTAVPYKVFVYEPASLDSTEVHQIKLA